MTPELWARLNPLFVAAVEKPHGERSAFIAKACGNDSELRRELIALVEAHEQRNVTADKVSENIKNLLGRTCSAFSPGDVVIDRFRIVRMLGSGGMGDVYEAFDLELSQAIALKSIRPGIVESAGVLSRFRKEVQLARRLNGPNVCRIHELFIIGSSDAPTGAFLTMELLDGITLSDRIRQTGPISWREAQRLVNDICAGLATIHEAGIIHRDLKSRNIMLVNRAGSVRAVVMDLGLAHEVAPSKPEADTALTLSGAILGTPEYMAPEQFEGNEVTPATDLFALGIVLYEMLTGKRPFPSSNMPGAAVLRGKRLQPPSSMQPGLPRRVDRVIGRCLEYEPANRFQSIDELCAALQGPFKSQETRGLLEWTTVTRICVFAIALGVLALGLFLLIRHTGYQRPGTVALNWYEQGTMALREGSYLEATSELQQAVLADPKFSVAHARLADAWAELDFTGTAEHEMLLASNPGRNLPELDRRYIEAVRKTLTRDFPGAERDYAAILTLLPADQKGYGYLDLGRAQEKSGDIAGALKSFETAATLRPDNPAPFVQLGILKAGHADAAGANDAFSKAEALYRVKHNREGLAEVALQRGHFANDRNDSEGAQQALQDCLRIAREIPNVQMEVRALNQLTTAEYYSRQNDAAIETAKQAIQLARDNGIDYWATDALVRMGNAYLLKMDFENADKVLQEALRQATQSQRDRLTAMAELSLASLRDRQGRWSELVPLAQKALKYYDDRGMIASAVNAATLVVRGQEGGGDFAAALVSLDKLLELTQKSNAPADLEFGQEEAGSLYAVLEHYPEALDHFQRALAISRDLKEVPSYQPLHCADILWRLGRYSESEAMLRSIPVADAKRADIAVGIDGTLAEMRLSQERFAEAYRIASDAIHKFGDMPYDRLLEFQWVEIQSENALGRTEVAKESAQKMLAAAENQGDRELIAEAQLAEAVVNTRSAPSDSAVSAEAAKSYFSQSGRKLSKWTACYIRALIAGNQKDAQLQHENAQQALDILSGIEQTWGSPVFNTYSSRPDIHRALRELKTVISR